MHRILLLEDNVELRDELAAFLRGRGWAVSVAGSLGEFQQHGNSVQLAIIDIMLPDGCGFEAIRQLRERAPGAGIIALTARGSTRDVVQGLDGGADHYLIKPVKLVELAAIIGSLARRVPADWSLQACARQLVSPQGQGMPLSRNEFVLMQLLAQHGGPVSRRRIVEAYGEHWLSYDQRRLDTLISRLRKRCRDRLGVDLPLKTEHGEGYSFTRPLTLG